MDFIPSAATAEAAACAHDQVQQHSTVAVPAPPRCIAAAANQQRQRQAHSSRACDESSPAESEQNSLTSALGARQGGAGERNVPDRFGLDADDQLLSARARHESGDFVADGAEQPAATETPKMSNLCRPNDVDRGRDSCAANRLHSDRAKPTHQLTTAVATQQPKRQQQQRLETRPNNETTRQQVQQNVAAGSSSETTMNKRENQIESEEENLSSSCCSSSSPAAPSSSTNTQPDRASPMVVVVGGGGTTNSNSHSAATREQQEANASKMQLKTEEQAQVATASGEGAALASDVCARKNTLTSLTVGHLNRDSQSRQLSSPSQFANSNTKIREANAQKMVQNIELPLAGQHDQHQQSIATAAINLQKSFCSSSVNSSAGSSSASSSSSVADDNEPRDPSPASSPINPSEQQQTIIATTKAHQFHFDQQQQDQQSNILMMLQHLTRRRDELRLMDRQLSDLMTDCLAQLQQGGDAAPKPIDSRDNFDWAVGQQQQQQQRILSSGEDYLVDYRNSSVWSHHGYQMDPETSQQAVDLTMLNSHERLDLGSGLSMQATLKRPALDTAEITTQQEQPKQQQTISPNLKKMRLLRATQISESDPTSPQQQLANTNQLNQIVDPISDASNCLNNNQLATTTIKQVKFQVNETSEYHHHHLHSHHQNNNNLYRQQEPFGSMAPTISPNNEQPMTQRPVIKRVRPLTFQPTIEHDLRLQDRSSSTTNIAQHQQQQQQQQFHLQALDYIRQHLVSNPMANGAPSSGFPLLADSCNFLPVNQMTHNNDQLVSNNTAATHHELITTEHHRLHQPSDGPTAFAIQQQQTIYGSGSTTNINSPLTTNNQLDGLIRATIQSNSNSNNKPAPHHHNDSHHQHHRLVQRMSFRCHVCGSGFEDRHRLQQHLSIHLNLNPSWFEEKTIKETMAQYELRRGDYLCQECQFRFDTTAEFDKHMQLHGEKPHHCELCRQDNKLVSFRFFRQLLTHLRSHCFLYSCKFNSECKQTANRKDYLKLHILKHHLNNKLPEQYTICCH